jgi:hypothetical protein
VSVKVNIVRTQQGMVIFVDSSPSLDGISLDAAVMAALGPAKVDAKRDGE